MCHELLQDSRLFNLLLKADRDIAEEVRKARCPRCGGRLDRGDFERKPRGLPDGVEPGYHRRASLCCSVRGCRKRKLPPSLRFLGRRVFLFAVVVLASIMDGGVTEKRARELNKLVGVSIRTLHRWRRWWRTAFVESRFWKAARARFAPPVDESPLPGSLLERFDHRPRDDLIEALRFLSPLSVPEGYVPDP